ncbi:MAG: hypothetical protein V4584_02925 [Verrucomicrobiota bacterium]
MRKSTPENPTKNLLEWIVFGISTALVLAALAFLTLATLRVEDGPAEMRAEAGTPVAKDGWLRIPVTVKNHGQRVAANVEVRVCIGSGADKHEAGFTVDFVPRGGSRTGAVSFKEREVPLELECEVLGYEEP